jgi:hypothetical protein
VGNENNFFSYHVLWVVLFLEIQICDRNKRENWGWVFYFNQFLENNFKQIDNDQTVRISQSIDIDTFYLGAINGVLLDSKMSKFIRKTNI